MVACLVDCLRLFPTEGLFGGGGSGGEHIGGGFDRGNLPFPFLDFCCSVATIPLALSSISLFESNRRLQTN